MFGRSNGYQAVLWDMDGTLADTKELHYQTWYAAGREIGLTVTREIFDSTFGQTGLQAAQLMTGGTGFEPAPFVQRKEELFREMAAGYIKLHLGVKTWLETFDRMGLRQAIASSGPPQNIEVVVSELHIRSYFSVLGSGEGRSSKPNPATFLTAAERLCVDPAVCLVIEDAPVGIEAAHRAGMKCIATTTTNPPQNLQGADVVVSTLADLKQELIPEN